MIITLIIILCCLCSSSVFLYLVIRFLHRVWWIPSRIRRKMSSQGIQGPPYKFIYGSTKEIASLRNQSMGKPMDNISHDIFPRLQPHVYSWTRIYGKNFLNWHGSKAQLFVTEAELIREILSNKEGAYPKMEPEGSAKKLLGEAIITNEGENWAKVRKLANHTFHADSLKVSLLTASSLISLPIYMLSYNIA
ncbi:hypothetical protein M9H77_09793 [Catharanthus roseus]|uniref:Uncharacterized protein n=1 Tax=Catharanthus roseus TaxID=4058 RepID=A0ACC0C232_CATRO|nr:hypothetical protein M9H77_09793 [Catharanthus roseus]